MARLYPLHLVTLAFYVAIGLGMRAGWLNPANPERYDFAALIPQLTLTQAWGLGPAFAYDYPNWALSAVFGCYLALPTLTWFGRRSAWLLIGVVLVIIAVGMTVAADLGTDLTHIQTQSWGIVRALPSVVLGLALGRWRIEGASRMTAGVALTAALVFAFHWSNPLNGPLRLFAVYLLVAALLLADRSNLWTPLRSRILQSLGKYSFGIYLLHSVVATTLLQVIVPRVTGLGNIQLGHSRPVAAMLLIGLAMLTSLALARASLRTVERQGAKAFIAIFRAKHPAG